MSDIEILNVDPPFSFFKFAEQFGNPNPRPLKRILSLMRKNSCRTIIKRNREFPELTKSDSAKFVEVGRELKTRKITELLFFKKRASSIEEILKEEEFLGYAVVCQDELLDGYKRNYVMNSVIIQPRNEDDHLTCWSEYKYKFSDKIFEMRGSFFSQQHSILNVCAHTAIKIAFENLRRFKSPPPSILDINSVLNKIDPANKSFAGMTSSEMIQIISNFGFKPIYFDFSISNKISDSFTYQQMAYYAIESGMPVIISFLLGTERHVITAVGHTFNDDTWMPLADNGYFQVNQAIGYHRSSSWMGNLIIHDDNYGPYYCLPINYLLDKAPYLIIVCPHDLNFFGHIAEMQAAIELYDWVRYFHNVLPSCKWMHYFLQFFVQNELILRTILVSKDNYVSHLPLLGGNATQILEHSEILPDVFWLVEISLPEIFPINKKKVGEIIIDPSACHFDESIQSIRLPGIFIKFYKEDNKRKVKFLKNDIEDPCPLIAQFSYYK